MTKDNVASRRMGAKIVLYDSEGLSSSNTCVHHWIGYQLHQFNKWRWFFRYRAALLQLANPKKLVELTFFSYPYMPTFQQQCKLLTDRIRNKKGKLTQWKTSLRLCRENWAQLFPVEDDPDYKTALGKVNKLAAELESLERELYELKQANEANLG